MIYEVLLRVKVEADCYEAAAAAGHETIKTLAGRADYALVVIDENRYKYLITPEDARRALGGRR